MMNYLISGSASQIKPSVSFLSMSRNDYKQTKYCDEQDGPSALQMLGNEKSAKDKKPDAPLCFESERNQHTAETGEKMELLN